MTTKRMKSREVRDNWRDVLDHVRAGNEVVVEHYTKPIARIVPIEESAMFTSHDLRTQVVFATDASDGEYDVDAIVEAIIERHGAVDIKDLKHDEFWGIVMEHATD